MKKPKQLHLLIPVAIIGLFFLSSANAIEVGLLFSNEDVPRIRANTEDPVLKAYWEELLARDVEEDGNFVREAFIYVMTGEEARGRAAKRLALEMAREERWALFEDQDGTPIGFLRTSGKTRAVALAYDWLYDLFTAQEREELLTAIADKGCQPIYDGLYGFKYPESVIEWQFDPDGIYGDRPTDLSRWPEILSKNNFRAVMNGGLALGLAVVRDKDDRAADWEAILMESIPLFNSLLKDDGSYDEAVAYINYAMKYQVMAMEVAKRKFGRDFFDTANFTGLIDYVLAMYLPSHSMRHGSVSFGDAGSSMQSFASFWIARESRDGLAQHLGIHYSGHFWQSFLYYDPTVQPLPPAHQLDLVELDLDWIIARTGYGMDDLVVAMRSGKPMNHEHADRNSILVKAFGEILLSDPGKVTYDSESPEWVLRTAKGHNMVLIDGKGIQYHKGEEGTNESLSSARIVRSGERPGYFFWASDATPAYKLVNPDVASVTRTVVVVPGAPCVVVLDKVVKASEPSRITARWQLENRDHAGGIEMSTNDAFTFIRPHARLHGFFGGTGEFTASAGRFNFPDETKDFRFVDVSGDTAGTGSLLVTVASPLRPDEPDPVVRLVEDGDVWEIHYTRNGAQMDIRIFDNGPLPEFEVLRNPFAY